MSETPLTTEQHEYVRGVWYGRIGHHTHREGRGPLTPFDEGVVAGRTQHAHRWSDEAIRLRARREYPASVPPTEEA